MKKIDYSCDLLNAQCYSIGKIAEMSGFVNTYYFSRVFKSKTGVTPTQYRNNML